MAIDVTEPQKAETGTAITARAGDCTVEIAWITLGASPGKTLGFGRP